MIIHSSLLADAGGEPFILIKTIEGVEVIGWVNPLMIWQQSAEIGWIRSYAVSELIIVKLLTVGQHALGNYNGQPAETRTTNKATTVR